MDPEAIAYDQYYLVVQDRNPGASAPVVADATHRMLRAWRYQGHVGEKLLAVARDILDRHREGLVKAEQRRIIDRELANGRSVAHESTRAEAVEAVARAHPALYSVPGAHPGAARSAAVAPGPRAANTVAQVEERMLALAYELATDFPDADDAKLAKFGAHLLAADEGGLVKSYRAARAKNPRAVANAIDARARVAARAAIRQVEFDAARAARKKTATKGSK